MQVTTAHLLATNPPHLHGQDRKTPAHAAGLRYEAKVQAHLLRAYGDAYLPGAWFEYTTVGDARPKHCELDGILFDLDRGKIVAVEIKLRHTERAAEQVLGKYFPVLKAIFPTSLWTLAACEVTRWYDRDVKFPVPFNFVTMPDQARADVFGIMTYRARG